MTTHVAKVLENEDGELLLEFPPDLLDQMGWDENTVLEWIVEDDHVILREYKDE